jgi:phosphatidate cytidylyltransferase
LSNFFRRTLTGAGIVSFILGGLWLHPVSFVLTGLVLLAGTQYEYFLIIRNTGARPQMITGLFTGVLVYILSTLTASGIADSSCFLFLIVFIPLTMIVELYRGEDKAFDSLSHTFFSVIYTAVPFSLFPFTAFSRTGLESILPHEGIEFSPGIPIGFFILMWVNDSGAYLAGITFGKHRLWERISPKKTWEGFAGGFMLTMAAALLIGPWIGIVSRAGWLAIAILISVFGTFGDLVESMLKRCGGVKDSGKILPGHGGFLDRFDSVIVSFPMVYLFISLFG